MKKPFKKHTKQSVTHPKGVSAESGSIKRNWGLATRLEHTRIKSKKK